MQVAVSVPNAGDPAALVEFAVDLERAGYDGFFVWDHLQLVQAMRLDLVDPWVLLGAVAQATERIRLGTMVAALPRRRPWKLAKEITTLDHLSGGRVICGFGLGFPPDSEFEVFGEESGLLPRARAVDEALGLMDRFLRGEPVSHRGEHYQVEAQLLPGCLQSPRPPFWIAATRPFQKPLERARRWDGVVPLGDEFPLRPKELEEYVGDLLARPDFSVVNGWHPEHRREEYEAIGVDWLIESTWPEEGWLDELRQRTLS
jgi:alkanesulfonate monooxygenase SsuD/methylene tetrahydromethanopterin reductase-like flavin-dependent oxidoreductase (luciferase family)